MLISIKILITEMIVKSHLFYKKINYFNNIINNTNKFLYNA